MNVDYMAKKCKAKASTAAMVSMPLLKA